MDRVSSATARSHGPGPGWLTSWIFLVWLALTAGGIAGALLVLELGVSTVADKIDDAQTTNGLLSVFLEFQALRIVASLGTGLL